MSTLLHIRVAGSLNFYDVKCDLEKITIEEFKELAIKTAKIDGLIDRIGAVTYLDDVIDLTDRDGSLQKNGVKEGHTLVVRPASLKLSAPKKQVLVVGASGEIKSAVPSDLDENNIWKYLEKTTKPDARTGLLDWVDKNGKKIFESKSFVKAPKKLILEIIKRDTLRAKEEIILTSVVNWVKTQDEKGDLKKNLTDFLPLIRFGTFSTSELATKVVPLNILESADILELFGNSSLKEKPESFSKKWNTKKRKGGLVFTYQSDWDTNGILYYLGTNKGTVSYWSNPHPSTVNVTYASHIGGMTGSVTDLISRTSTGCWIPSNNYTTNGAWFVIDFQKYEINPNYYTLRDSLNGGDYQLRNWVLEGSSDNSSWDTLRTHSNDTMITSQGMSGRWSIESDGYYRYIRVRVTGYDRSGTSYFLFCSGFEIYGSLSEL